MHQVQSRPYTQRLGLGSLMKNPKQRPPPGSLSHLPLPRAGSARRPKRGTVTVHLGAGLRSRCSQMSCSELALGGQALHINQEPGCHFLRKHQAFQDSRQMASFAQSPCKGLLSLENCAEASDHPEACIQRETWVMLQSTSRRFSQRRNRRLHLLIRVVSVRLPPTYSDRPTFKNVALRHAKQALDSSLQISFCFGQPHPPAFGRVQRCCAQ